MQRRDPRSFLEGVLADIPEIPSEMRKKLLDTVADKPGTKRAQRLAAILTADSTASDDGEADGE